MDVRRGMTAGIDSNGMSAIRRAAEASEVPYAEFVQGCIDLVECGYTVPEAIETMQGRN